MENYKIDNQDVKILNQLLTNANMPYSTIARKLGVSTGTIHVRMRKMEAAGIARPPQLQVDFKQLGWDITAFIGVYLVRSDRYDVVVRELKRIDEVISCHYTTGNYSLFLRIVCRDTDHLRKVLHDKIQTIEGISRTETLISLEESFSRPLKISV
ncbi:MAG: Lrp/AsnC ligand binding domain-containing protein [Chitinophagales bacterium]